MEKNRVFKRMMLPLFVILVMLLPVLSVTPLVQRQSNAVTSSTDHSTPIMAIHVGKGLDDPVAGQIRRLGVVDVSTLAPLGPSSTQGSFSLQTPSAETKHQSILPRKNVATGSIISTPVTAGTGFVGLNESQSGNVAPPDPQVAAGPTSLVEMVNVEGAIYTKQGTLIQYLNLSSFFKIPHGDFLSDPRIFYDGSSGRWFSSIIALNSHFSQGNVTIAVSSGSDPTGTWNIYVVNPGPAVPDQPGIGISDDKFVVSANDFFGNFTGAQIWVLNKTELVAGASTIDLVSFGPDSALFSVHPAHSLGPTSNLYLASVGANGTNAYGNPYCASCSTGQVFTVAGSPPGTVTISTYPLSMTPVDAPPPIIEHGSAVTTGQIDSRILDAVWSQGKLWFSLTDGCIPTGDTVQRDCVRLIEVDTNTLTVKQNFDFCSSRVYCYYPALGLDAMANLAIIYGFSNSTVYPSVAVTGQTSTDPANSLRQPVVIKNGTSNDVSSRFGDYFGAGLDPIDQTLVWVAGEYDATNLCGGGCWVTLIDSMRVVNNAFSLASNPARLSLTPGQFSTSTITVTSLGGFSGSVNLAVSVNPIGPSANISPSSVTIASGGSATATLSVSSAVNTLTGNYVVNVTGTSGSNVVSGMVYTAITGFSLSSASSAIVLSAGSSRGSSLTLTSLNDFSGTVSLSSTISPVITNGPAVSFNPSSLQLSSGASGSSTLTVSTVGATPVGVYIVNITGTGGSESHSIIIPVAVTNLSITINNTTTFTGTTVVTSGTLSLDSPSSSLTISGNLTVTASNSTTGTILFKQIYNVQKTPIVSVNQQYFAKILLDILVNPYPLSSGVSVAFSGTSSPSTIIRISRNPDIYQNGFVGPVDLNIIQASRGCQFGTSCYNPKADLNADGVINLSDLAYCNYNKGVQDTRPDFPVSANPASLTVKAGSQGTSTITLASLNNYTGIVTLAAAVNLSGMTATLNPTSLTISRGGQGTSTLTVSSTLAGLYTLTITATSGNVTHTISLSVNLVDFSLTADNYDQNQTTRFVSNIAVGSMSGLTGLVVLNLTAPGQPPLMTTLSPINLNILSYGTGTSKETTDALHSCPVGQVCGWTITITATSGSLSHSFQIRVKFCHIPQGCPNPGVPASGTPASGSPASRAQSGLSDALLVTNWSWSRPSASPSPVSSSRSVIATPAERSRQRT